jgi:hypothetical protein
MSNYIAPEQSSVAGKPVYKYPADLGTPPHEKWILFEVRTGRHIGRTGMNTEGQPADRTLAAVALYLPTGALTSSQDISWETEAYGAAVGAALEKAYQQGQAPTAQTPTAGGGGLGGLISGIAQGVAAGAASKGVQDVTAAIDKINETAGVKGADSTAALEGFLGKTVNPRTDVLFKNVDYRTHRMSFKLMPRSYEEARTISNILNVLQYYSLPSYGGVAGETSFFIGYPYEFVITMFSQVSGGGHHINTIDRSVLTTIEIDHAAGQQVAFVDKRGETQYFPVATSLELSFKEVRLRGRDVDVDGLNPIFRGTNNRMPSPELEDPRLVQSGGDTAIMGTIGAAKAAFNALGGAQALGDIAKIAGR